MDDQQRNGALRISEFARLAGTSPDTLRYYERLGLLGKPQRTVSGYRLYRTTDLGRVRFIRRAKRLGLSLDEIRALLAVADAGGCGPVRRQVAEALRQKIAVCEAQLADLIAFKEILEACYQQALDRLDGPACECVAFPATCGCLPVPPPEMDERR